MKSPLINAFDFDSLTAQCLSAPSFPHFCLDNFLEESFANAVHDAFPSYAESKEMGTLFNAVNEKKKIQIPDSTKFPPAIYKLHELLASQEFVDKVSELMGIPNLVADPNMVGGGIHETNATGHLDVHIDFNFNAKMKLHRRVNIIIYFNKNWPESYGGALDLWDKEVQNRIGYYPPIFNRAVGFVTNEYSWHGVTPLTCPENRTRKSFAVYYYTKEAPVDWDGSVHSTIFKARPNEHFKGKVAMPIEKLQSKLQQLFRGLKQRIKNLT